MSTLDAGEEPDGAPADAHGVFTAVLAQQLAGQYPGLTELNVSSNGVARLQDLSCLRSLVSLDVSSNRLTNLHGIEHLHLLRELLASNNYICELDPALVLLTALTHLDLQRNQLDTGHDWVDTLRCLPSLQHLDLRENPIHANAAAWRLLLIALPSLAHTQHLLQPLEGPRQAASDTGTPVSSTADSIEDEIGDAELVPGSCLHPNQQPSDTDLYSGTLAPAALLARADSGSAQAAAFGSEAGLRRGRSSSRSRGGSRCSSGGGARGSSKKRRATVDLDTAFPIVEPADSIEQLIATLHFPSHEITNPATKDFVSSSSSESVSSYSPQHKLVQADHSLHAHASPHCMIRASSASSGAVSVASSAGSCTSSVDGQIKAPHMPNVQPPQQQAQQQQEAERSELLVHWTRVQQRLTEVSQHSQAEAGLSIMHGTGPAVLITSPICQIPTPSDAAVVGSSGSISARAMTRGVHANQSLDGEKSGSAFGSPKLHAELLACHAELSAAHAEQHVLEGQLADMAAAWALSQEQLAEAAMREEQLQANCQAMRQQLEEAMALKAIGLKTVHSERDTAPAEESGAAMEAGCVAIGGVPRSGTLHKAAESTGTSPHTGCASTACASKLSQLQAQLAALQATVFIQEQQLLLYRQTEATEHSVHRQHQSINRQQQRGAVEVAGKELQQDNAGLIAVLRLEAESLHAQLLLQRSAAESQRSVWSRQALALGAQFAQARELLQVLERRTHDARAEAQQLRSQLSEAQAKAAEHAGRAKALGTVRAQQDAAAHALKAQAQQLQTIFDARMAALAQAAASLDAYVARLRFATERLGFAQRLQSAKRPVLAPAVIQGAGAFSGSTSGGSGHWGAGLHDSTTCALISGLQGELSRLQHDREQLLGQLAKANTLMDTRVHAAESAVLDREARTRHGIIQEQVQALRQQLQQEAQAQVKAAQHMAALVEQEARTQAASVAAAAQSMATSFQAAVESRVTAVGQRMQQLQSKVHSLSAAYVDSRNTLQQLQQQLSASQAHASSLQQQLQAAHASAERGLVVQLASMQQELADAQRRADEADARAGRASVLTKQLERQLARGRESQSSRFRELEVQAAAQDDVLRSLRRERAALLAILRKSGAAAIAGNTLTAVSHLMPGVLSSPELQPGPGDRHGGKSAVQGVVHRNAQAPVHKVSGKGMPLREDSSTSSSDGDCYDGGDTAAGAVPNNNAGSNIFD